MSKQWNCAVCNVTVIGGIRVGTKCRSHSSYRKFDCSRCGKDFWSAQRPNASGKLYCSQECRTEARQSHRLDYRVTKLEWKQCPICQAWVCKPGRKLCRKAACLVEYKRRHGERKRRERGIPENHCRTCLIPVQHPLQFCGEHREAALKASRKRMTLRSRRKYGTTYRSRARKFGVEYQPVNKQRVFQRDGWRCGICGSKVDKRLKDRHPMMASLDHIVPMSLGGGHTYLNTQCSHLMCNLKKSFRSTGDQLALIG